MVLSLMTKNRANGEIGSGGTRGSNNVKYGN